MDILSYEFYSNYLKKRTTVKLIGPVRKSDVSCKICFLFHGLGGNRDDFSRHIDLESYAKKYGIIFVTFDGERSFYVNNQSGIRYYDFVSCEVTELVTKVTGLNLEETFNIALGVSMGGYGAFLHGQSDLFDIIGSISGSLDLNDRTKSKLCESSLREEWLNIWGYEFDKCYDLFEYDYKKPIVLACGDYDHLITANQKMYNYLKQNSCDVCYYEVLGTHDWECFKFSFGLVLGSIVNREYDVRANKRVN